MRISIRRSEVAARRERPVYQQIADQVREQIESGTLAPGHRLPPIRALAQQLGVNRDTVSQAYDALARSGAVESTVGRGTFVRTPAPRPRASALAAPPALNPRVERLLEFERGKPSYVAADGAVPLHSLIPDPSLYPSDAFRRTLNQTLARGGAELLAYGTPQGHEALREVIAKRLAGHGLECTPDEMVICHGASQGMSLAARLYAEPGARVAVEEPTYHNLLAVLVGLGLRPVAVPMTEDGPDLDALDRTLALSDVRLFYTMPSFHNPLGTTSSLERRRALLEIAARHGKPVIEDSFEVDLRYEGPRVPPLAALDGDGLVVHLFSFSKSLFPGVRVGAVSARGRAVEALVALKNTTDLCGSVVLQAAIAEFVRSGAYDRHLERMRRTLRERRDTLLEALEREMPSGARWTRPEGGSQVWLELPGGIDTAELLADAKRAGVVFAPGYQFHHDGRPSNAMRLAVALADTDEIRRGVAALGRVVRERLRAAPTAPREANVHV